MTNDMTPAQQARGGSPADVTGTGRLRVLTALFERLHAEGIRYCHWKSNEHLDDTMTGATDVDVLVERSAAQRLTQLLTETPSFKRFVVKPGHGYPGIEDYVGFDPHTGMLTHLHVHYQLTLGEKFIKGHRLPWEALYLSTRVLDGAHSVYITDPHVELLVLIVRSIMKLRARDYILEAMGRRFFRGGLLRELRWLVDRIDPRRLQDVASGLVGERAARSLNRIVASSRPSIRQLLAFARRVEPPLSAYRMYTRLDAARRMAMVEWSIVFWKLKHWLLRAPTRSNRTLPQGGVFIVLEGADGPARTALTAEIAHWLSREAAVTTVPAAPDGPPAESAPARLRRIEALRSRGWIVLSEGTPGDAGEAGASPEPAVVRGDRVRVRLADFVHPDLVIRLRVPKQEAPSPATGAASEPRGAGNQLTAGSESLPTTRSVDVDAGRAIPEVLRDVKRAVWECL